MTKPTIFAEAVTLAGKLAATGAVLPAMSPKGFSAQTAMVLKAAVAAAETTDAGWLNASPEQGDAVAAFFASLQRDSALIAAIQRGLTIPTPLHAAVAAAITNISAYQQGELRPIPVSRFTLQRRILAPATVDAMIVVTRELLALPGASALVETMLTQGCGSILDSFFHNVMADSSTPSFVASGTSATAFFADLKSLFAEVFPTGTSTSRAFFVTDPATALAVSLLTDTTGALVMGSMGLSGGLIAGIPAFVSPGWPAGKLSLFNGSRICTALDNSIGISSSDNATIEMNDAPSADAGQGVGTSAVSMFQTSASAVKISMRIAAERAVDSACAETVDCGWL